MAADSSDPVLNQPAKAVLAPPTPRQVCVAVVSLLISFVLMSSVWAWVVYGELPERGQVSKHYVVALFVISMAVVHLIGYFMWRCQWRACDEKTASASKKALITWLVVLFIAANVLDGGWTLKAYILASIAYWMEVAVIWIRRSDAPTRCDLLFIRYGPIALLFAGPLLGAGVYRIIGESPLSGLERLLER